MKHLRILSFVLATVLILTACNISSQKADIIDREAELQNSEEEYIIVSSETSAESLSEEISSEEKESKSESSKSSTASESSSETSSSSSSVTSSEVSTASSSAATSTSSSSSNSSSSEYIPPKNVNTSDETRAVWISYLEYQNILTGKSESSFQKSIRAIFNNLVNDGFNTVFVHARSHSDAYYDSDIFPCSVYCSGKEGKSIDFDPLSIMVEEAHNSGLNIEAWVNPYRVKGTTDISKISESSPAYDWLDTDKVVVVEGKGIFYNPADEDVIDLVVSGVEEIVRNYDVDGIHFDDYFYPTTSESFDSKYYKSYKNSGGRSDLASWRRQNVNTLIKRCYSAIKSINSSCRFGISPTGNTNSNYNELYCDVETWVTNKGYIDYICPQIYYGFKNESQPYLTVLDKFDTMIKKNNIELIVGLAAYKSGAQDTYAGTGKSEWKNNTDILSRQVIAARNAEHYGGFSLYRYDSVYNPSSSVSDYVRKEKSNLLDIL